MAKNLPILAAIPLVVLWGLWEGVWTNRWQHSTELEEAAARLQHVPLNIGEWQGKDGEPFTEDVIAKAEITGYLLRSYLNPRTGEMVQVLVICGASGPTAVHTPDICFRGAGFAMTAAPVRHAEEVKGQANPVEMWTAEFHKTRGLFAEQQRAYWTWSADGTWSAPSTPRWHYAGQSALFKLYVIRPLLETGSPDRDEVCMTFLQEFLPQLNQAIFAAEVKK